MKLLSKIAEHKTILIILGAGFLLRFVGIWYGLPYMYNSDEPFNVINALAYGAKKSLEPTYFVYPALYSYLLLIFYGLYFVFGLLFGLFENAIDFGVLYFTDPTGLFLIGRLLSVVLGTATIWMVYKTGERFFSKTVGIFSAVLLALSLTHIDLSHWILLEALLAFICAAAIFFTLKYFKTPSIRTNILAAIICGLAISTKYNAGFIVLPLLLATVFLYNKEIGKLFTNLGVSAAGILFGFVIASPYWLISFSKYWQELKYSFSHVDTGMIGHMSSIPVIWPLWEIVYNNWTIGLVFIAGFFFALFQLEKKQILLAAFVLVTLLFIGFWDRTGIHYLIPVFPAMAVLAGVFVNDISQYKVNRNLKLALILLFLAPPFVGAVIKDSRLTQTDTRTIAKSWIEANIPTESMIAYENYVYGPNLFDPARFVKNESENQLLPLALKERLLAESLKKKSYRLINLRKDYKLKALATLDTMQTNEKSDYVRQLLETRLPKLSSVKKSGVPYLVISSDNYARYFENKPPEEGTPIWLAYQNGRKFYESVFQSSELKLLREFRSTRRNLGPTIRFYQFINTN